MGRLADARRSRFIRYNSIFFIGAAAVGALNYVYYPVMGRMLSTAAFGEVQTLVSLFLQATIFLSVLGLVTINVVTNYTSDARRNAVVLEFEKLALLVSLALLLVVVAAGRGLEHFWHFDSAWPFGLLVGALVVSVPLMFRGAFLRGKQRFGQVSVANVVGAGGKLLLAMVLVELGLGTAGAIGGLIVAQLLAWGLSRYWARRAGLELPEGYRLWRWPDVRLLAPELRYGLLVLAGSLIITLQYSLDVVVVKHYFSPQLAGLYAGVASVARIIFFMAASIALVMMSLIKLRAPAADNRRVLVKSLLLTAAVATPLVTVMVLAPRALTKLLMGQNYGAVAGLLPRLGLAVFIVTMLNVVVAYYLALRRYALAPVLAAGAVVTYVLMYLHHTTLSAVVGSLLAGSLAMLGMVVVWMAGRRLLRGSL